MRTDMARPMATASAAQSRKDALGPASISPLPLVPWAIALITAGAAFLVINRFARRRLA